MRSASNCKRDQALMARAIANGLPRLVNPPAPSAVCDPLEPRANPPFFFLTDKNLGAGNGGSWQIKSTRAFWARGACALVRGSFLRLPFKRHRFHVALFEAVCSLRILRQTLYIVNFSGLGCFHNGFDGLLLLIVGSHDFKFRFRKIANSIFTPWIDFLMALLMSKAFDFLIVIPELRPLLIRHS